MDCYAKRRRRILLCPDSFKGSLTARQACRAMRRGVADVWPDAEATELPMADGGEGTADILTQAMGGKAVAANACDALGRPVDAAFGLSRDGHTAIVELAAAAGYERIAPAERNVMMATTRGAGMLMMAALRHSPRHILLCLGGSATCDAALGLLQAMGVRLRFAASCKHANVAQRMLSLEGWDANDALRQLAGTDIELVCDVANPFCGPAGAARVFAPQKGADAEQVEELESGMRHVRDVALRQTGIDLQATRGAGAAGGVAGMMHAVLGARIAAGTDVVLNAVGFDKRVRQADIVITGEGRIDAQTLGGKALAGIAARAGKAGASVWAVAGGIGLSDTEMRQAGFARWAASATAGQPLVEAMRPDVAAMGVRQATAALCMAEKGGDTAES